MKPLIRNNKLKVMSELINDINPLCIPNIIDTPGQPFTSVKDCFNYFLKSMVELFPYGFIDINLMLCSLYGYNFRVCSNIINEFFLPMGYKQQILLRFDEMESKETRNVLRNICMILCKINECDFNQAVFDAVYPSFCCWATIERKKMILH